MTAWHERPMEKNVAPKLTSAEWETARRARDIPRAMRHDAALYDAVDELLAPDHEPQLIAKGGEHLVFELQDRRKPRDVVIKVNFRETLPLYDARQDGDTAEEQRLLLEMRQKMRKLKGDLALMKKYFGAQAVPAQQFMIRDVPVTEKVALYLEDDYEALPDEGVEKLPAWISIQRKLDLDSDRTISLDGYYQERRLLHQTDTETLEEYDALHRLLAQVEPGELTDDEQREMINRGFDSMANVSAMAEYDEGFRSKLQEPIRNMIRYTQETRNILDLAGTNNAVMSLVEKSWALRLPDALSTWDVSLDQLKEGAEIVARGGMLEFDLAQKCYYALNTVRVINALAIIAGIEERVDLPYLKNVSPESWRTELMQVAF